MGFFVRVVVIFSLLLLGFDNRVRDIMSDISSSRSFEKIHVVKHTWHTGIILSRGQVNNEIKVIGDIYPDAEYIEIGWGDQDFFTSEKGTVGLALKAVLWPTKSVLHVRPYYRHPSSYFDKDVITELQFTGDGVKRVLSYLNNSFALDQFSQVIPVESESTAGGQFYLSVEKYHLFKTCNVWTARALKKGGFSIVPFYALSSKNVLRQIRKK